MAWIDRSAVGPDGTSPHPQHTRTQLLESEKTFVEQMATLVAVFIKPLRWWQAEIVGSRVSSTFCFAVVWLRWWR